MNRTVLLHYHEIILKGGNRGWFENKLHQHVARLLRGLAHDSLVRYGGRMFIPLRPDSPSEELAHRLKHAFGVANFCFAWRVPAELEAIRTALVSLLRERTFRSFKIDARRGTKGFPLNSQQLNEELGRFAQNLTGAAVRLENPELTVFVEIVGPYAYIYFEKKEGAGGLPSGTGGKVVALLSGGIDSPVAAYRLMRRGCHVLFVHFHSFPHTTTESQDKVRRIVSVLGRYQLDSQLILVPFSEVQREIVAYAPPPLRVILYRRFMMRIAEAVAIREKAAALATGDSLGQVASQTLENLRTVSEATKFLVFRPLVGDDKEDIVRLARAIETYPISILPDQDCCSLFVPRHPETMSNLAAVEKAEQILDISRLIETSLGAARQETIQADYCSTRKAVAGMAADPGTSMQAPEAPLGLPLSIPGVDSTFKKG